MCVYVYIIENPRASSAISLDLALKSARLDVGHRLSWESFRPEQMRARKPGLIVANVYPESVGSREFFSWLLQNSAGTPTLAILPADDAELIRIASTAVDDFLLRPGRDDELHHRLLRLLWPPVMGGEKAARGDSRIAGEMECCSFKSGKRRAIESFERDYIRRLLDKFRGNITRAAREAGKDRRAFGRLAKKYGLGHTCGRTPGLSAGVNQSN